MTLEQLRARFRQESGDLKPRYLWSNAEIDQYLNEAEADAARRGGLLVDSTSEASEAVVFAGDLAGDLHPSVVYIRRARRVGGNMLTPRVSRAMDEEVPGWEDNQPSTPIVFVPDWESGKIRLWPTPTVDTAIKMSVVRTPLSPMVNDSDTPEIPARYHDGLVFGALARGYLKRDADTYDPEGAAGFEGRFAAIFGPAVTALDEHWALEQYYDIGHR